MPACAGSTIFQRNFCISERNSNVPNKKIMFSVTGFRSQDLRTVDVAASGANGPPDHRDHLAICHEPGTFTAKRRRKATASGLPSPPSPPGNHWQPPAERQALCTSVYYASTSSRIKPVIICNCRGKSSVHKKSRRVQKVSSWGLLISSVRVTFVHADDHIALSYKFQYFNYCKQVLCMKI